jgi:hypothetical protein
MTDLFYRECPKCLIEGDLMGDDESLFECSRDESHIWSYHLDCKKASNKPQNSDFIGWLPYDVEDEDFHMNRKSIMNHERFQKNYNSGEWEDCSKFVWKCKDCKKYYWNMMCG